MIDPLLVVLIMNNVVLIITKVINTFTGKLTIEEQLIQKDQLIELAKIKQGLDSLA